MDLTTLHEVVAEGRRLGERRLGNGTELIGHVPHVAPEAWLHILFAPIEAQGVSAIRDALSHSLPSDYLEFLQVHNGLRLFSGDLWMGGHRKNYARSGDFMWQPFCVVQENREYESIEDGGEFIIGGEERTGATIRYRIKDGGIFKYNQRGKKPTCGWESLECMLSSEVSRLSLCFDSSGKRVC